MRYYNTPEKIQDHQSIEKIQLFILNPKNNYPPTKNRLQITTYIPPPTCPIRHSNNLTLTLWT